jgi:hypothetical protein
MMAAVAPFLPLKLEVRTCSTRTFKDLFHRLADLHLVGPAVDLEHQLVAQFLGHGALFGDERPS